ncbi:hypothetical protein ACKUB1_16280 [Methanospirillum stamsii]|uniref:Uncharacterized protein n=1 Tax=Methanospirillum stamsii TaxID=1277351 RepID=A0A2V2NF81_9EURY|nr:hypothetical protein [Methanospirillum stamsii]PWR75047.1 hypothetical protein DLD82_07470 [Methanospirillum stamsii]
MNVSGILPPAAATTHQSKGDSAHLGRVTIRVSTRKNSYRWMAGLTRNRVLSAGISRPITRNERRGRPNLLRSERSVTIGVDDAVQPALDHSRHY